MIKIACRLTIHAGSMCIKYSIEVFQSVENITVNNKAPCIS